MTYENSESTYKSTRVALRAEQEEELASLEKQHSELAKVSDLKKLDTSIRNLKKKLSRSATYYEIRSYLWTKGSVSTFKRKADVETEKYDLDKKEALKVLEKEEPEIYKLLIQSSEVDAYNTYEENTKTRLKAFARNKRLQ